jgi:hypothetical protein
MLQRMNGSAAPPRPRCACDAMSGIEATIATTPAASATMALVRSSSNSRTRAASCSASASPPVRGSDAP